MKKINVHILEGVFNAMYNTIKDPNCSHRNFIITKKFLSQSPNQMQGLTDSEFDEIREDLRNGLLYYDILSLVDMPQSKTWVYDFFIECLIYKLFGKPIDFSIRNIATITFKTEQDLNRFCYKYTNASPDDFWRLQIGDVIAYNLDPTESEKLNREPDYPVVTMVCDDNKIILQQRYAFGPSIDFDQLRKDLSQFEAELQIH